MNTFQCGLRGEFGADRNEMMQEQLNDAGNDSNWRLQTIALNCVRDDRNGVSKLRKPGYDAQ
jgi:hypothetical protein